MTRCVTDMKQSGSIAMALLATIVISGIIVALFITVDTGVETARRDRDWNAAILAADAGIQEAIGVVRDGDITSTCPGGVCSGAMSDGATYTAEYTQTQVGWTVCSTGSANGVDREACADIDENLLVGGAGVIGLEEVRADGNLSGLATPIIMGTGGVFTGVGNACGNLESLEIYPPSDAENPCPGLNLDIIERTFPNLAEAEFLDGGVCYGQDLWLSYPSTPPDSETRAPWTYGEDYCVRLVDVPKETIELTGNPDDGPVRIFVDPGDTTVAAAKYAGNGTLNLSGEATDLLFFVRQGEVSLDMKGTSAANAVWYAPTSLCDVRGTPDLTGAIVCREAHLGGSVNMIVPDDIRTLRAGPSVVERWYEP